MKYTREFYEAKAHESLNAASDLLDDDVDAETDQAITWALATAQVYATLATAAPAEGTRFPSGGLLSHTIKETER